MYNFYANGIPDTPEIFVKSISEEFEKEENQYILYENDYEKKQTILENFIESGYASLTEGDLEFMIKYTLNNVFNANQDLENDLKKYEEQYNTLVEKYELEYREDDIWNKTMKNLQNKAQLSSTIYTNVDVEIKSQLPSVNFVKINEIFNKMILNENIPFIALNKREIASSKSKAPLIKVFNHIDNSIDIKNWVLNEKKNNNWQLLN